MLLVNLATGILIARVLGPEGRGALTAVFVAPPIIAWIFEMGCVAAATYHQARRPSEAPRLVATWLVILAPLAIVGTAVGLVVLPHLLAAQSEHTLTIARLVMLTLSLMFVADLMNGVVLGDQDFVFYNAVRILQPLVVALVYGGLWLAGALNVSSAAAATVAVTTAVAVAGVAVHLVYGGEFSGSVAPLRILLLGAVLYAAAKVVCSGLYALDRPFTAALAQGAAAVVTVVGLLLFLERGGIEAGSIISTVAYSLVFGIALLLYRRAARLSWRELAPTPTVMAIWLRQATRGALGRA